jgi:hypothetical protein
MNMNSRNEISPLADQDLDAVVGGRMATGMDPKPAPGGVVQGVPAHPWLNSLLQGVGIGGTLFVIGLITL